MFSAWIIILSSFFCPLLACHISTYNMIDCYIHGLVGDGWDCDCLAPCAPSEYFYYHHDMSGQEADCRPIANWSLPFSLKGGGGRGDTAQDSTVPSVGVPGVGNAWLLSTIDQFSPLPNDTAAWSLSEGPGQLFYIDPSDSQAVDVGNTWGSFQKPRKTVPAASLIPDGAVVALRGLVNLTLENYANVEFRGADLGPMAGISGEPHVAGELHVKSCTNCVFQSLRASGFVLRGPSRQNLIRNLRLTYMIIGHGGDVDLTVVYGCVVNGNSVASGGIAVKGSGSDLWLADNVVSESHGPALHLQPSRWTGLYARHNVMVMNQGYGLLFEPLADAVNKDVVFSANYMHSNPFIHVNAGLRSSSDFFVVNNVAFNATTGVSFAVSARAGSDFAENPVTGVQIFLGNVLYAVGSWSRENRYSLVAEADTKMPSDGSVFVFEDRGAFQGQRFIEFNTAFQARRPVAVLDRVGQVSALNCVIQYNLFMYMHSDAGYVSSDTTSFEEFAPAFNVFRSYEESGTGQNVNPVSMIVSPSSQTPNDVWQCDTCEFAGPRMTNRDFTTWPQLAWASKADLTSVVDLRGTPPPGYLWLQTNWWNRPGVVSSGGQFQLRDVKGRTRRYCNRYDVGAQAHRADCPGSYPPDAPSAPPSAQPTPQPTVGQPTPQPSPGSPSPSPAPTVLQTPQPTTAGSPSAAPSNVAPTLASDTSLAGTQSGLTGGQSQSIVTSLSVFPLPASSSSSPLVNQGGPGVETDDSIEVPVFVLVLAGIGGLVVCIVLLVAVFFLGRARRTTAGSGRGGPGSLSDNALMTMPSTMMTTKTSSSGGSGTPRGRRSSRSGRSSGSRSRHHSVSKHGHRSRKQSVSKERYGAAIGLSNYSRIELPQSDQQYNDMPTVMPSAAAYNNMPPAPQYNEVTLMSAPPAGRTATTYDRPYSQIIGFDQPDAAAAAAGYDRPDSMLVGFEELRSRSNSAVKTDRQSDQRYSSVELNAGGSRTSTLGRNPDLFVDMAIDK